MGIRVPHPGREKIVRCFAGLTKRSQLILGLLHGVFEAGLIRQISRRRVFQNGERFYKLWVMRAHADHICIRVHVESLHQPAVLRSHFQDRLTSIQEPEANLDRVCSGFIGNQELEGLLGRLQIRRILDDAPTPACSVGGTAGSARTGWWEGNRYLVLAEPSFVVIAARYITEERTLSHEG